MVSFHGNGGHPELYGTHRDTYNFKTTGSNALTSCTHTHSKFHSIQLKKGQENGTET